MGQQKMLPEILCHDGLQIRWYLDQLGLESFGYRCFDKRNINRSNT